jgi:hypothetical protein
MFTGQSIKSDPADLAGDQIGLLLVALQCRRALPVGVREMLQPGGEEAAHGLAVGGGDAAAAFNRQLHACGVVGRFGLRGERATALNAPSRSVADRR